MYLVSYDISSNRRRRKVAKLMENYGTRVQYSVFECKLEKSVFNKMYQELCDLVPIGERKRRGEGVLR